jgi:hypothetical protein
MINNKTFEHRPISQLMSIVKNTMPKFDIEGLIDEGLFIKTILRCNDRLGIPIREIKEVAVPVTDYKAKLPVDFDKMYYICALDCTNSIKHENINAFYNNFDSDVVYNAKLDRESLGCVDNYRVIVERKSDVNAYGYGSWTQLQIDKSSARHCHNACPNLTKPGKYSVSITDDNINTPFKSGTLYLMYLGNMINEEGELLFPFHPMITPWYEWSIKYEIVLNAIFNSNIDKAEAGTLLQLATKEKSGAWLDAFNFTTDKGFGEYLDLQKKKELGWYNQYFKYFQ